MASLHIDSSQIKKLAFPKHGVHRKAVDNHLINIIGRKREKEREKEREREREREREGECGAILCT